LTFRDDVLHHHSLLDLLAPEDRAKLIAACTPLAYSFGDVIIREGEDADALFILVSGRARVVQRTESGEELILWNLQPGEVVGETALLQGGKRTATVRASSDVNALRLDQEAFDNLRQEHPAMGVWLEVSRHARLLFGFLKRASAFRRLPSNIIRDLVKVLKAESVSEGDRLIRQGDPPGPMYLIQEGRLRVLREEDGKVKTVGYLREGDVAGEIALLRDIPRTATVEAMSDCKVLALSADDFHTLEDRWPEFRHAVEERVATYDYQSEARLPLDFVSEVVPAQAFVPPTLPEEEEVSEAASALEGEASEEEPFAAPGGLFRKRRSKRRFHYVRQIDEMDCGVACLAMVCRHYGRRVSLTRLHALAHTATDGTTLRNLCHAAEELGLAARPLRVSRQNFDRLPLPAVLHWEGDHWVVVVDVRPKKVRIADPGVGDRWLPREEVEEKWTGYAAIFDVTPAFAATKEKTTSWDWVARYIRPHTGSLGKALGLALIASLLTLALPVLTQVVVDRVVIGGAAEALTIVLVSLLAVFVFRTVSQLLQGYLIAFVAVRIDAGILDYLARRLLSLPVRYFQSRRTTDIQRRLDGARQVRSMAVSSGVAALLAVVQIILAVALMVVYSPALTSLFVLVAPLYAGLALSTGRYMKRLYDDLEDSAAKYRGEQLDALRGIESVKATSAEYHFRENLIERFLRMAKQQFRADLAVLSYQTGVEAAGFLTSLLFLWLGAQFTMAGELTLGAFVAFISLVALAVTPLGTVLTYWDDLQVAKVLVGRLQDVLDSEPEQGYDRARLLPVKTLSGAVELRGVGFRYGGPESPSILSSINLKVQPGQTLAIVGRSGSGKTTLVKLLAGLLEATEGSIIYDGVDLRTLNYRDLRRKIGFVLQDTHLFSSSVLENIALGDEPNLERAVAAARAAAAHEFIERLPLGYETRVGEAGLGLSGGQRQRIAIARAIYSNPTIIVFDEATSSLDAESERAILENMSTLFEGRTVFVIAHRLSTIRDADWTVVLEQGEIVEQGTHDELMDRRGLYFYLVSRQVEA